MTYKNRKKLSAGCSLLRTDGFSFSLDVLYGGLGKSQLHRLKNKISFFFFSCNFFQFLVIKTLEPDRYSDSNAGSGSGLDKSGSENAGVNTNLKIVLVQGF